MITTKVFLVTTSAAQSFQYSVWSRTQLPESVKWVLVSVAPLIQSGGLFLQAGLEHTVRSSLPSRWAGKRPGPRGQTLYLKLNDWAEIHPAKAVHLTMLFTKLARDIPAQIADLSPWHNIFIFFWPRVLIWHLPNNPLMFLLNSYEQAGRWGRSCFCFFFHPQ